LQDGVHIKERGNVALPVDIVKVLKTQDENYVRTMRSTGLKVHACSVLEIDITF
jgi:U3 small nucleolar RNA-associated protein 11